MTTSRAYQAGYESVAVKLAMSAGTTSPQLAAILDEARRKSAPQLLQTALKGERFGLEQALARAPGAGSATEAAALRGDLSGRGVAAAVWPEQYGQHHFPGSLE